MGKGQEVGDANVVTHPFRKNAKRMGHPTFYLKAAKSA